MYVGFLTCRNRGSYSVGIRIGSKEPRKRRGFLEVLGLRKTTAVGSCIKFFHGLFFTQLIEIDFLDNNGGICE